ncbi:MAG: hypothetical protein ABSH05_00065 [Bryobacteraceae bacterium]|jgi:hypothetical protein
MRITAAISILWLGSTLAGQDLASQAQQLEAKGDALGALQLLQRAARSSPKDPAALLSYAEYLDYYHDPESRPNYEKALALLDGPANQARRARVARRLVLLDLIDGDRDAAAKHLEVYRASGGKEFAGKLPEARPEPDEERQTIEVPGPLRSFSRMAALAPDTAPSDLLPALARNVVTNGYQAAGGEALEPTEYLKLVTRYLSQARELQKLGGAQKAIRIETCDSPQTGEVLRILGYRMRGGCGSEVVLETVNASRAFLTIDSGFPLAQLEQALRTNRPFSLPYPPTRIPILYGADYWITAKEKQSGDFIDVFLSDPALCRFYVAMAKLDRGTADELRKVSPVARLKVFAHVLDFFGDMFEIRDGKAVVPGGMRTAAMWGELAGVSPDHGAAFFDRLISKDDGWMASYFDALARIGGPAQEYLTEPQRMKRFYLAIRGRVTSPGPARPVFRSNTDMMLLTTRLRLEPDGRPHIPGNIGVWKEFFANPPHGKYDGKLMRAASGWKEPDDVLEALFGLCRKSVENEPLKIFMTLSDLGRFRSQPLDPATVSRLAREYRHYGAQYSAFADAPALRDQTVIQYLDTAQAITHMGDTSLRADTAGMMQALVGLWQIFCRQGSIPASEADSALAGILSLFAKVRNSRELFDDGRAGVDLLLKATHSPERADVQDRFIDLLAGAAPTGDSEAHSVIVQEMIRIFEAQRLVSLNSLLDLADNLERLPRGEKLNATLVNRLAARISEIQLPRAGLSTIEKSSFSFGYWSERHIQAERKLNLRAQVERAGGDAEKLLDVRGALVALLRDTLVGFVYIYYAPPGAQLLLTNPVFVRSHDFVGMQGSPQTWQLTQVVGAGWPASAGGRLMGSLAGLPYTLAEAEQNFMVPTREQALIWGDLVPQLVLSAKVPRWWNVTPAEMHWVGLHMRYAESLLAEGALDARRRQQVAGILEGQAEPARVRRVGDLLERGEVRAAIDILTPAELFVLAQKTLARDENAADPLVRDLVRLQREAPDRLNYQAVSHAFGTPKPTLTSSYRPELLYLRTFPALMGFSSRIMAESWESTVLYWVALADEVHVPPSQLNVLIPEWTRQTIEGIFATHLEDWPALLRSLRKVGEEVRSKARIQRETDRRAALP